MAGARSFLAITLAAAVLGAAAMTALRIIESRPEAKGATEGTRAVHLLAVDGFSSTRALLLANAATRKLGVDVRVVRPTRGSTVIRLANRRLARLVVRRGRRSTISIPRLDPRAQRLPVDPELTLERTRKLVLREIAVLHLGRRENDDARSVLYRDAVEPSDVDFMTEDAVPRYARPWNRWIAGADRACFAASDATAAIADRRVRVDRTQFLEATLPVHRRLVRRLLRLAPPRRRLHRRFAAALRADLAADDEALEVLSRTWSRAELRAVLAESRLRSLALQSLALRLGSAGCGAYFDPS